MAHLTMPNGILLLVRPAFPKLADLISSYLIGCLLEHADQAGQPMRLRSGTLSSFGSLETVTDALIKELTEIPAAEISDACKAEWGEIADFRKDMRKKGKRYWIT